MKAYHVTGSNPAQLAHNINELIERENISEITHASFPDQYNVFLIAKTRRPIPENTGEPVTVPEWPDDVTITANGRYMRNGKFIRKDEVFK